MSLGRGSGGERLPVLPLVEAVLGAVMYAQLPVELEMIVLHQFAQDVQELIKADLAVLVFVSCPEELCDVVWLPAALPNTKRSINTQCAFSTPVPAGDGRDYNSMIHLQGAFRETSSPMSINDKVTPHPTKSG